MLAIGEHYTMEIQTNALPPLIAVLLHPMVVGSILLITSVTALVLWRYAEDWQRVWMVVVIAVYVGWLMVALII